jgi:dienelactone hydrolase
VSGDGESGDGGLSVLAGDTEALIHLGAAAAEADELDRARLERELAQAAAQLDGARARLANDEFLRKAPQAVVDGARAREAELADQVAGVRHLISIGVADPARIGITGWSYGGYMTLNALLNAPDVFQAGISGAPVTNWLNYDTIYTERYMGLPKENPDAYKETALPPRAANLKGKLLLIHNFEDDNVLFQNSLQMTAALQQAGKQFEFMLYPQKSHGVTGGLSRQMNQLMLDFFDRALR